MSEDTNVEDYEIFYYSQGRKYFTPSEIYASYRAKHYGTNKVYIEKN